MLKSIHFGAGKIGRGFIGAVLNKAGYDVTFADVNQEVIDLINEKRNYTVHIIDKNVYSFEVNNVSAVNSASEEILDRIAEADLITTAVGIKILPFVAPAVAKGIIRRKEKGNTAPLNIICCENGIRATSTLKGHVCEILDEQTISWMDGKIGFADSSVDRIVPLVNLENPLDVAVEEFYEWNVEEAALVGSLPPVSGLNLTDNLDACVEKKLFTLNTGHCATAFLGMLKGYTYIHEAIADEEIQETVRGVMSQSGAALIRKFGIDPAYHAEYVDIIIGRFSNPHLKDRVTRVGHDPIRKLGANLYFAYPIKMATGFGLPYDRLATAAAAALLCDQPDDQQSVQLQSAIKEMGVAAAFTHFSGISDPEILAEVEKHYRTLQPMSRR